MPMKPKGFCDAHLKFASLKSAPLKAEMPKKPKGFCDGVICLTEIELFRSRKIMASLVDFASSAVVTHLQ